MKDTGELNRELSEFQHEYQMPQILFKGVQMWPLVKSPVYDILFNELGGGKLAGISERAAKKDTLMRWLPRLIGAKLKLAVATILTRPEKWRTPTGLIVAHMPSRLLVGYKYALPFADSFLLSGQPEFEPIVIHNDKGYVQTDYHIEPFMRANALRLPGHLHPLLAPVEFALAREALARFRLSLLQLAVADRHLILRDTILVALNSSRVLQHLTRFAYELANSITLIRALKPRFVLLSVSQSHAGLIVAAKRYSVPVYEIQHGLITPDHRVYDWPRNQAKDASSPVPDKILLWGEYWKNGLLSKGYWRTDELVATGNPRFDRVAERFGHKVADPDKLTILFTSNATIATESANFLNAALSIIPLDRLGRLKLRIKLHPNESSWKAYQALVSGFPDVVEVVPHIQSDLYVALSSADIHISAFSIAVYESLGLGIPTYVLDIMGSASVFSFDPLFPAVILPTPIRLSQLLDGLSSGKESITELSASVKAVANDYFRPGAEKRMLEMFNEIARRD